MAGPLTIVEDAGTAILPVDANDVCYGCLHRSTPGMTPAPPCSIISTVSAAPISENTAGRRSLRRCEGDRQGPSALLTQIPLSGGLPLADRGRLVVVLIDGHLG
jgi:hypothetical protein